MSQKKLDFNRVFPIFALTLVDILGLTIILPLLHLYAAKYGANPLEIGLVAAAFPLSQLIGVPVMGTLSDRYGRKPLLLISQVSTCISFIILGAANSLLMIVASRVFDGLFGANISTAQAALSDVTTEETRAQGLGLTGAAFGIGFIIGPVISLVTLEFTNSLSVPAYIAASYSFVSILITLFGFHETLPPEKRDDASNGVSPLGIMQVLKNPSVSILLVLMFAQQIIFFGFESLLGLFTLSRLGMLGQGNALLFIIVGVILVMIQLRYIGYWSQKYGERKLVYFALGLLTIGLLLTATTPEIPHPFYVQHIVENELLADQVVDSTEAIIGQISITLPDENHRGILGVLWIIIAVIPISIGAGLIRPSLNSLMTKRINSAHYGSVLGLSAAFVSAANAIAPLLGGLVFQNYGSATPFLLWGTAMGLLLLLSLATIKPEQTVVIAS